uniref:Uncharacterized protein n=1 Tax=Vitis vinifera TaxID=29760 RepID=F6H9K9_VITVI
MKNNAKWRRIGDTNKLLFSSGNLKILLSRLPDNFVSA